jgi:DNA-binding beta-propeller fold protein YncE
MTKRMLPLIAGATMLLAGAAAGADTLVVGNKGENTVSFIDLVNGREVARAPFGPAPHEVALAPDGRRVAVVAYGGEAIALFDVASRKLLTTITLPQGARPHGIVWHANGRIYASAEGIDAMVAIERPEAGPDAKVTTISTRPAGAAPRAGSHMVVVDAGATRAWTANLRSGSVTLIDLVTAQPLREAMTGGGTEGIALSPDGRSLWVTARDTGQLMQLDPDSLAVRRRVTVGKVPLRVILSPDGRHAVTSNYGDGTISVVRTANARLVQTLQVPGGSASELVTLLFSANGKRLYAALTRTNRVAEFSFPDGRLIGQLAAGVQGDGLAIAPVQTRANPKP